MNTDLFARSAAESPPPENDDGQRGETLATKRNYQNTSNEEHTTAVVENRPRRKWERVLAGLLSPGARHHRFSAETQLGDHTLPSTIARMQDHGLAFERRQIVVRNAEGTESRVTEYWLADRSRDRARELLGLAP